MSGLFTVLQASDLGATLLTSSSAQCARPANRTAVAALLVTVWRAIKDNPGLLTCFWDFRTIQRGSDEAKRLVSPDGKPDARYVPVAVSSQRCQ